MKRHPPARVARLAAPFAALLALAAAGRARAADGNRLAYLERQQSLSTSPAPFPNSSRRSGSGKRT